MKFDVRGVLTDAWAMWRADRDLLLRVTGFFFFLPQYAMLLLMPAMPPLVVTPEMSEADQRALAARITEWVMAYGGWYVAGLLLVQAGSLIVLMLYLQRDRPDLGSAIARGARLYPRYLLAMIVVGLPLGLGVMTLVLLLPGLYLLGRLIAVGPALAAAQPLGVAQSLARSWAMTRGHGFVLAGLVSLSIVGGALAAAPFAMIAGALEANAPNVVAIALADAGAAAAAAAALLATVLLQIAAYRRLAASKGI
ncbi:hypothetical protein [Sphingomonas hylomeconis]|uniref:Glycerophosphoryl diester phosphodiesterase membrane domain-containing protein n=1 Tax=Sphingomonas hylomeconis TaxID=1395958 RepID=A0ABV7SZX0_9SPHN|nr:hypothetical protein [Sphingomonas hylomeconis]